jgi:acyl-CoA dehydrogenase
MNEDPDSHQALRDAVRQLCRQFPGDYFRKVDAERLTRRLSSTR